MLVLITGGAKNGKSGHAERIFAGRGNPRIYLATMEPYGDDAMEAIARHQAMRAGKGFQTIEKYRDIQEIEVPEGCDILIECMSTLCANEMFTKEAQRNPAEKIADAVDCIRKKAALTVVVTNDVGSDGIAYGDGTAEYIRVLGELNRRLAKMADSVIECVCGIPVLLKGELPWEF